MGKSQRTRRFRRNRAASSDSDSDSDCRPSRQQPSSSKAGAWPTQHFAGAAAPQIKISPPPSPTPAQYIQLPALPAFLPVLQPPAPPIKTSPPPSPAPVLNIPVSAPPPAHPVHQPPAAPIQPPAPVLLQGNPYAAAQPAPQQQPPVHLQPQQPAPFIEVPNSSDSESDDDDNLEHYFNAPEELRNRCLVNQYREDVIAGGDIFRLRTVRRVQGNAPTNIHIIRTITGPNSNPYAYFEVNEATMREIKDTIAIRGPSVNLIHGFAAADFLNGPYIKMLTPTNIHGLPNPRPATFLCAATSVNRKLIIHTDLKTLLTVSCDIDGHNSYNELTRIQLKGVFRNLHPAQEFFLHYVMTEIRQPRSEPLCTRLLYIKLRDDLYFCPLKENGSCRAHPVQHFDDARPTMDTTKTIKDDFFSRGVFPRNARQFQQQANPNDDSLWKAGVSGEMFAMVTRMPPDSLLIEVFNPIVMYMLKMYLLSPADLLRES